MIHMECEALFSIKKNKKKKQQTMTPALVVIRILRVNLTENGYPSTHHPPPPLPLTATVYFLVKEDGYRKHKKVQNCKGKYFLQVKIKSFDMKSH